MSDDAQAKLTALEEAYTGLDVENAVLRRELERLQRCEHNDKLEIERQKRHVKLIDGTLRECRARRKEFHEAALNFQKLLQAAELQLEAARRQLQMQAQAMGAMKSAILSGEPWSDTLETMLRAADKAP